MEKINIMVAFCQKCGGYHSAAPADQSQVDHPEIVDHFFYHGEPWFTLDQDTFKKATMLEETEVRTVSLNHHREYDYMYCKCSKKVKTTTKTPVYQFAGSNYAAPVQQKAESEIDVYFRDVYSLCYNFQ